MMGVPRRALRGAAALVSVLFMISLSAVLLAAWHESDADRKRRELQAETGRVFAMWLQAAHRATMRTDYRAALTADPDGFAVSPAALPGAPAGLPVSADLTLGVMSDGSGPAPGVPMAWAVLVLPADARPAARAGAFGAGLVDVGIGGSTGGAMSVHEAAVGAARGAAVPAGALFATADLALSYEDEALFRRAQPGRPWATRMEAELVLEDGGGTRRDIDGAAAVEGIRAESLADVSSEGSATVAGDAVGVNWSTGQESRAPCVGSPADPCLVAGAVDVTGDAINPGNLTATGDFAGGSGRFAGELRGNTVRAVGGRIGAGSFSTLGSVDASLLVIGGALDGVTELRSATRMVAEDLRVNGVLDTSSMDAGTVRAGNLDASGVVAQRIDASGDIFGPSARITRTLTVSPGGCNGC
ncbi:MAG: hypothetical protein OYH76_19895 [Defluviicoccus sp.]|nr:hypothetical protein [Defluviicoccus sp.]MDE0278165.1 hypothetical protein [Defluviicoccus sp.]